MKRTLVRILISGSLIISLGGQCLAFDDPVEDNLIQSQNPIGEEKENLPNIESPKEESENPILSEAVSGLENEVVAPKSISEPIVYSNESAIAGETYTYNIENNSYIDSEGEEVSLKAGDIIIISSEDEWINFADYINSGKPSKGINWKLSQDIVLTDMEPVGKDAKNGFEGNFDGNSKKLCVENISINSGVVGVFGYINGATVQNLNIEIDNVSISFTDETYSVSGIIADAQNSKITNCNFSGAISSNGHTIGGIVGIAKNTTIESCNYRGSMAVTPIIAMKEDKIGGIVGHADGHAEEKVIITECSFNGSISGNYYVGGIAGLATTSTIENVTVNEEENNGEKANIEGYYYAGGIVGKINTSKISNAKNYGNIEIVGEIERGATNCGGIAGEANNTVINTSSNNGIIKGLHRVGGLVGHGMRVMTSEGENHGQVSGLTNTSYVGGIAGLIENDMLEKNGVYNSYNTGSLKQGKYIGGIVGGLEKGSNTNGDSLDTEISQCFNTGEIVATQSDVAGGIAGKNSGTIEYSYNGGSINGEGQIGEGQIGGISGNIDGGNINYSYNIGTLEGKNIFPIANGYEGSTSFFDRNVLGNGDETIIGSKSTYEMISGALVKDGAFGENSDYWMFETGKYPQLKIFESNEYAIKSVIPKEGVYLDEIEQSFEYKGEAISYGEDESSQLRYIVVGDIDTEVSFKKVDGENIALTTIEDGASKAGESPSYAGTYTVNISGNDIKVEQNFVIEQAELLADYFDIEQLCTKEFYTGKEVAKAIEIKDKYKFTGKDFVVSYVNNKKPSKSDSKAKLVIKGNERNFNDQTLEYSFDIIIGASSSFTLEESGVLLIGQDGEHFINGQDPTKYKGGRMFYLKSGEMYQFLTVEGGI